MAQRQKALLRSLFVVCAAVAGLLALSAPATAQVSIVPDQINGGGTQTVAFRLANERPDTKTTRLELTFPADPPIAYVKVDPVPGWTVTIRPRPLNPPVTVGGQTVSQVADALVLEGGPVGPGEFEQFLVTMGPLPADGKLAFEATQNFADGSTGHWGGQTAPVLTLGSGVAPGGVPAPASPEAQAANAPQTQPTAAPVKSSASGAPFALLWVALAVAVLVIALVYFRARRRAGTAHPDEIEHPEEIAHADEIEVEGR
ncbi:DUF1775 domain-containing protein [Amycolatopsis sp.]|uniref:DUF1775 domain-containing protein n=1 Tax=Amycolatopsis sp. TaxID=37632 RepID=UPI002C9EC2EB|nr:DUF1775 domain-containing protein [Amycolatopsis sp.]HVV14474.1 DUF1775 domain-containing protein [Amycolatopsis sp.]